MSKRSYSFDPEIYTQQLVPILAHLDTLGSVSDKQLIQILKKHPKDGQGYFNKSQLIAGYKHFHQSQNFKTPIAEFINRIKKKPIRTISGVTPVTVLTKPFPCPGKCIFCPNDVRMPKSYLSNEPGAQRATRNAFDPYLQTYNRLLAFHKNGHSVEKIELIILGGTWSYYPESYQIWFIKRCFDAMNDFGSQQDGRDQVRTATDFSKVEQTVDGENFTTTYNQEISKELVKHTKTQLLNEWEHETWEQLEKAQVINETSNCRNVGLVIETRPDNISPEEVIRIRRLGCTKTQIGFQSLQDSVLDLNKRGHDVAATRRAMKLLRAAGFKIHIHWMPNLYGSSVEKDIEDYDRIFSDPDFRPDELKIYPCSLIATAELMSYYKKGLWKPYTHDELLEVVSKTIQATPEYCRLTRVIRDIPSDDIVVGNKLTNFRQIAEKDLDQKELFRSDIRSREIKDDVVEADSLRLDIVTYDTSTTTEHFLQYVTPEHKIVGFLRLSLPNEIDWSELAQTDPISRKAPSRMTKATSFIDELKGTAMIREIHVYGVAANLGEHSDDKSQHLGLGTKLIAKAKEIARDNGFESLAVISAIGTREYYRKKGFSDGQLYQFVGIDFS